MTRNKDDRKVLPANAILRQPVQLVENAIACGLLVHNLFDQDLAEVPSRLRFHRVGEFPGVFTGELQVQRLGLIIGNSDRQHEQSRPFRVRRRSGARLWTRTLGESASARSWMAVATKV